MPMPAIIPMLSASPTRSTTGSPPRVNIQQAHTSAAYWIGRYR